MVFDDQNAFTAGRPYSVAITQLALALRSAGASIGYIGGSGAEISGGAPSA
jgi:hypothetical protein